MSKQSDLINGTFTDSIDVTGTVVADGLTVDGSGGQVTTDNNGFIISKQLLDVETAGGRFIGKSNRGELGHIAIEQTATSADGGYIRFATSPAGSTTPADRMMIDSTGAVTMPYQPAFSVNKNNVDQNNIATGSEVIITWDTARFDQNSDFDLATNTFTAPITGKYQINLFLRLNSIDTASNNYIIYINTSNVEYKYLIDPLFTTDPAYWSFNLSVLADMDIGDTAQARVSQSGGTAQTDISGAWSYTNFQGYLVC